LVEDKKVSKKSKAKELVERAEAAADRIEAAEKRAEERAVEEAEAKAEEILGGDSEAGAQPIPKKEETPAEYKDRVMSGEADGEK